MRVAFIVAHALVARVALRLGAAARIPYGCSVTFPRGPWCVDLNVANRIVWSNGRDDVWRRIDRGAVFVVAELYGHDYDDVVVMRAADEVTGAAAAAMVRRADGDDDE
jgi:hypothetical protein